ncbi:MAG: hypothetical protein KGZ65_15115 [Sphingomonadales bacterium]|nr:hypothetical protein [Sphingomonadaceae bacterium]MBS3932554.1 hypothetical protein [Sphingomonadales bacterium]
MNAIMTDFDFKRGSEPVPEKWEGFAELDRALAENRLTEYRIRKAWADPLNRRITIGVLTVIACVFAFLAGASFGLW